MVSISGSNIRVPSLRLHKHSGNAVVTVRGRDIYCGKWGTPEAEAHYRRVIADLVASGPEVVRHHGLARPGGQRRAFVPPTARAITVSELLLAYVEFAEGYYRPPSRETEIIKNTCKAVRELFGDIQAAEFGPRQLKAVRQRWIDGGLARKYINAKVGRVIRIWKWGGEEQLVPASTWHSLKCLAGLRFGRSGAKETPPKESVPDTDFWSVVPALSAPVRAIFELLWWTGARSGEISALRTCDIIRDSEPWHYCLDKHKTAHHGHKRVIFFGPKARAVLEPFLDNDNPEKFLFSPAAAVHAQRAAAKVSSRSDVRRARSAATKRRLEAKQRLKKTGKSRPKSSRRPGERYNRHSLANALRRYCKRHNKTYFNPHRLRHTTRSRLEELVGEAAAAAVRGESFASNETTATLGHAHRSMAAKYGSPSYGLAAMTMEQYG